MYKYYESSTQLNHDGEVIIPPTDETSRHASRYLLAGGIAGAVSRTCTAPFDRLKIHLITHKGTPQKPLTILSAAQSIYGYGGWKSFFVGNGLNVLKIMPESAIKFYAYESFKRLFADLLHCQDKDDIPTAARFAAGGLAGICSQFTIYPLETVKTRMMVQVTTTNTLNLHKASYSTMAAIKPQNRPTVSSKNQSFFPYSLVLDTVKSTYARGGVKAFWPGLTIGLIGVFPYQAMDLGIYETLKIAYLKYSNKERNADGSQKKPNLFILLGCGAISGTIGASSVYPLSVIRTKLQAQGTKGHPMIYKSAWDAIHVTLLDSGVRGLYRGLGPSLLKVVPAISLTYVTYEWSKEKLGIS